MTYSFIPGFTLVLDGLKWNQEQTVFTKIPNGNIQMDTTTTTNSGGFRGVGGRLGSDLQHSTIIRKSQAKALLKFLYREITTVEQLAELKLGSVIRGIEDKIVWESDEVAGETMWASPGVGGSYSTKSMKQMLPALVIFEAE